MTPADTIAAISSAVGPAARMIVRISGLSAYQIASDLTPSPSTQGEGSHLWKQREKGNSAARSELRFNGMRVPAWIYNFPSPHSVTGEDVIEFHIPGNPLLARMLLDESIRRGARQAEPGEFTARAYFNGRIGLSQAEGVAATIAAHSERELTAARQLFSGELARRLEPIMDDLTSTLALIEVGIDFSEDDISVLSQSQLAARINSADAQLASLLNDSLRFDRLSHEPQIVLLGRPNAGKSTLLNALAETQRAIVSPQAGTTRDILSATVLLKRGSVRILDIAGLEDIEPQDEISRSMQSHARRAIEQADLVVLVHDCTDPNPPPGTLRSPDLRVETKIDLSLEIHYRNSNIKEVIAVSALVSLNLQLLRDRLDELAFGENPTGATLALNARHVRAIQDALAALCRARLLVAQAGAEILALELREALDSLGQVLGVVTPDEVLGRVFSSFCIGK